MLNPTSTTLPRYLPLFDPDFFHEPAFFKELEKIGYQTIMLGGTGNARMKMTFNAIREQTSLSVIIHPSSPGDVLPADLIFLVGVMNSNSHYTNTFGTGAITIAKAIAEQNIPYIPIAYCIMGESTARWYADAFLIRSEKIMLGYCLYANMSGYKWLLLDYEDPSIDIDAGLIQKIKRVYSYHLMIIDEFTPQTGLQALSNGVNTIITPSDIYEESSNPLDLAREFYAIVELD